MQHMPNCYNLSTRPIIIERTACLAFFQRVCGFLLENQTLMLELSMTDLYEARAILLGRLGRHDSALELYVYRLQDYPKAEEYVFFLL
jgi:hypothetical protein